MITAILKTKLKLTIITISLIFTAGCAAKFDYKDPVADIPMVFVKGGTYMMGSDENPASQPVHEVTVPDLFVSIYEITFAQYDAFCKLPECEVPSDEGWGRGKRPVINVSWHDANKYAAWLSEKTGQQYRLPSEAEWEYFARAGTITDFWTGEDLPMGAANCRDCGSRWDGKMTAPVGSFSPNPWGLFDTAGNVAEWTLDDYQKGYSGAPNDGTPYLNPETGRKVQRGGSWSYLKKQAKSHYRDYIRLPRYGNETGFRLVLIPDNTTPIPKK